MNLCCTVMTLADSKAIFLFLGTTWILLDSVHLPPQPDPIPFINYPWNSTQVQLSHQQSPFPSISFNHASSVYCVWLLLTWDFQLAPYSLLISSHPIKFPGAGEVWRVLGHLLTAELSLLNLNILSPQIWSFISLSLCLHYFKLWWIPINSLWIVSENLVWEKTASCPFIV